MKKMSIEYAHIVVIDEGDDGFGFLIECPSGEHRIIHSACSHLDDAEQIANTVNRLGVSACHIYDVIEDLLP